MSARVLSPVKITEAVYTACSVAEPDPTAVMPDGSVGEVAWVSGSSYTKGVYVIDPVSHRVYQDGAGGVSNKAPRLDPTRWGTGVRPTNKWALADMYVSTRTVSASPLVVTLRPGAIYDVVLFGLDGVNTARLEQWDSPGGTKVYDQSVSGLGWSGDLWVSYYFDTPFLRNRIDFRGLYLSSTCEIKLTLTGDAAVGLGVLTVGRYESLGFTLEGPSASPVDYSRISTDSFGESVIVPGRVATDLRAEILVERRLAATAKRVIDRLAGRPMVVSLSDRLEDDYLTGFGLVSAEVSAPHSNHSKLSLNLRGLV